MILILPINDFVNRCKHLVPRCSPIWIEVELKRYDAIARDFGAVRLVALTVCCMAPFGEAMAENGL